MADTIFVTGATGFVAKHIILKLLKRGYNVVGSVRALERGDEVRAAVASAGGDDRLRFVRLDLMKEPGWQEAMTGCDAVIHTASPFPLSAPEDEERLVRPAVEGTERVLKAANAVGIKRVVVTSSVAAISGRTPPKDRPFDERDWTDINAPTVGAYVKSKTLAEKAAWDFAEQPETGIELTVINPSLVVGTPLDSHFGSSIDVVKRLMAGSDPMVPHMGLALVDVEDVAEAHVKALSVPASIGQRIIVSAGSMWFAEMTATLKDAYPGRRIPTRVAPRFLLRILGLFDTTIKGVLPLLGRNDEVSNARARETLGLNFTPAPEAILKSARYLDANHLV